MKTIEIFKQFDGQPVPKEKIRPIATPNEVADLLIANGWAREIITLKIKARK
jgi:hypothetical protein